MCRGTSFCTIYANLHQTKINVCCMLNFYLISMSWCRCSVNHCQYDHTNMGIPTENKEKVFGSKVIFVYITKVSSITRGTRGWQPLQCLSGDRKISSSIASPWKSTVCVCCGQDWCRMKMLTHCCLFLVCYFWSAWLSPSLLHCPCSSLLAQQGHCASAGLIKDSLPHDCTRTGLYRHRCGIFYPLFSLSPLVADCCHTQRMSKAKFHSWSIAKPPVSSLPAPLAKANVCTSPKGGGWTILWQL